MHKGQAGIRLGLCVLNEALTLDVEQEIHHVAILHDKSTYGKGLADEMQKAFKAAGGKEKMYEAYTQGDKDFNALVSKMKANAIDVVYVGGYHTEAGLILRQMRAQGMKSQMISGDALATNEFWSITGDAGEGMLFTFGSDPRKRPSAAAVVKRFKDKEYRNVFQKKNRKRRSEPKDYRMRQKKLSEKNSNV